MPTDSLESRIDLSEQLVFRHGREIRSTRFEAARKTADLADRLRVLERLVQILTELLIALISACFGVVVAADVAGNIEEEPGQALLTFLLAMWIANFAFRKALRWCLK